MKEQNKYHFTVQTKQVTIYSQKQDKANAPAIYLHMVMPDNGEIYQNLLEMGYDNFHLITICGLQWEHDMAPWNIPPISEGDTPCSGGADDYLKLLANTIIPMSEKYIGEKICWRGIAGYSLAGLFAVYSLYQTDIFSRAVSISGSLWFPDFIDYATSHPLQSKLQKLYFSLGKKEAKTRNPYLKSVEENTKTLASYYKSLGIDTVLEMNPGNHFTDVAKRSAKGIAAIQL